MSSADADRRRPSSRTRRSGEPGKLEAVDLRLLEVEAEPDSVRTEYMASGKDRVAPLTVKILQPYAAEKRSGKPSTLTVRFPVPLRGNGVVLCFPSG